MATLVRNTTLDRAPSWGTDNLYLNGPWAPWTEETAAYDLPVEGEIPADLAGALFRISANPRFKPRDTERYHWFDGDGMIGGIYIRDGKVSYRMRWVETDSMLAEMKAGEAIYPTAINGGTFAPLPEGAPLRKNYAAVNVSLFADRLFAYYDWGLPTEVHAETLDARGTFDFHGRITNVCAAHFKIDPISGDMLGYAAPGREITWFQAEAATGKVVDSHVFDIGLPVMMHDFAVTEHHAVFFVTAAHTRIDLVMQGKPALVWDEAALPNGTSIVLMNRHTHKVTWHEVGRQFANTHNYNAFELDGKLVIHGHSTTQLGVRMDRLDRPMTSQEWLQLPPSYPYLWTIDLATGRVTEERLSDVPGDLPRINDAFATRQHRYGYWAVGRDVGHDTMTDGLAKQDIVSGKVTVIDSPDGILTQPTEPVFAAREGAVDEDDGYLLSLWWNRETRLSELLVHDAVDPRSTPLARVRLPARLPYGPHGNWATAAALDRALANQAAG